MGIGSVRDMGYGCQARKSGSCPCWAGKQNRSLNKKIGKLFFFFFFALFLFLLIRFFRFLFFLFSFFLLFRFSSLSCKIEASNLHIICTQQACRIAKTGEAVNTLTEKMLMRKEQLTNALSIGSVIDRTYGS